jgi:cysteate synthase
VNENDSRLTASTPAGPRHYEIVCSSCGMRQDDDGLILDCPGQHEPSLLRAEYRERGFKPRSGREGIFRYQEWLPVVRAQEHAGRTVVYRSKGLGSALGLPNLWIAFNGYWPERGADLQTATFKEFEAYTVLGRLPEHQVVLTVASSGNTGAAFALACSQRQVPCLIIVPGRGLQRLKFPVPLDPCVNLVVIDDGDYPDAIDLATSVCRTIPFQSEGGVKNIGRRDGLATVLLSAFEEMQCLPSHYFQAVGSGTGAIAALEAAKRIRVAFPDSALSLPRLMLCQNLPFTPIHDAWQTKLRSLDGGPTERFRDAITRVYADELTNWAPPYGIRGGVYDSLVESGGDVLVADNASVRTATNMFLELEGIDIEPAVGVALACLRDAVARQTVDKDAVVLLNATGGGRRRLGSDYRLVQPQPQLRLARRSIAGDEATSKVVSLCASAATS